MATQIVLDPVNTSDIAKMSGLARRYVTDKLIKRPDFPAPVIDLSQKTRVWERAHVCGFFEKRQRAARGVRV